MVISPLLWACNPEKEQVAPAVTTGVQNGTGPVVPPPQPVDDTPANMYTVNAAYVPNSTGLPPATATPGSTVYFCVLAAGSIPQGGQATILPEEADLVAIQITGTTSAGAPFSMTADRAALMDGGDCGFASAYAVPNSQMPNYGIYARSYRFVAWKVPPFMPAGTYQVTLGAYQTNGNIPRYFTAARKTRAVGTLDVNGTAGMPGTPLTYKLSPIPSAASPIFGLNWTSSQLTNGTVLRATIRNTATNRYYCLSPGSLYPSIYGTQSMVTCSGLPAFWNASVLASNTGTGGIRYNSTALVAGQLPAAIPPGNYQVYLDALDGSATNKYLTTAATTPPLYLP